MTNSNNQSTCQDFTDYIEKTVGAPYQTHMPATLAIHQKIADLMPKVNEALEKGDYPWQPFEKLGETDNPNTYILAATNLFPDEVYERTRLPVVRPPDDIHRMQRSNAYWVGDFFSANMIVQCLQECGLDQNDLSVLDIGCSSGSLLRVLGAYNHSWRLYGCDPVRSSITWAKENLSTAQYRYMENKPPLEFDDAVFDGVTAISVWSHHRPDAAKIWADEVARILKPGGFFAVTFSSMHHIRWRARQEKASYQALRQMLRSIGETGNFFVPFNYAAEDNETDTDWGQSIYSRENFFNIFFDDFKLAGFFPGANQGNQDLAIFTKR